MACCGFLFCWSVAEIFHFWANWNNRDAAVPDYNDQFMLDLWLMLPSWSWKELEKGYDRDSCCERQIFWLGHPKKRSMSSMLEYVKVNHARSCESVTCILWNFEPSGNPMQSAFFSREKCGTYTFHETDDIQRFYNIYWSWNALSWVGQLAIAYQEIRGSNLYWILYHEIPCNGLCIRTLKWASNQMKKA